MSIKRLDELRRRAAYLSRRIECGGLSEVATEAERSERDAIIWAVQRLQEPVRAKALLFRLWQCVKRDALDPALRDDIKQLLNRQEL